MIGNIKELFKKTPIIKLICFFIILSILVSGISYQLLYRDRKTDNSSYQIINFYDEKKDAMDVVFIGSSCCFSYYSPLFAYNSYGIKTTNFSSSGMGMLALKYAVAEVKKTQKNAPIVITLSDQDEMEYKSLHYLADYMPMSLNKINLIREYFSKDGESILNSAEYFFPLMRFHDRWSELTMDDLNIDDGTKGATRHEYYLTYVTDTSSDFSYSKQRLDSPETWMEHIGNLLDYCDQNGYEVMFMIPPKAFKEEAYMMMNSLVDYIESRNYYVLDMREMNDEMGINKTYDYYDKYHTNIHGSLKYTDFVIRKVMDRYNLGSAEKNDDSFNNAFTKYYEYIKPYIIDKELDMLKRDYHLDRPELLSVEKNDADVHIQWQKVDNADGYLVYRNNGSEWVELADVSDKTEYIDKSAQEGINTYTVMSYRKENGQIKYGNYDYKGMSIEVTE